MLGRHLVLNLIYQLENALMQECAPSHWASHRVFTKPNYSTDAMRWLLSALKWKQQRAWQCVAVIDWHQKYAGLSLVAQCTYCSASHPYSKEPTLTAWPIEHYLVPFWWAVWSPKCLLRHDCNSEGVCLIHSIMFQIFFFFPLSRVRLYYGRFLTLFRSV